jgi:hypothetical protein
MQAHQAVFAILAHDARLASATDALAAAVLYLSRDTSSEALRELQADVEVARAMLAHARLLYEELPAVDETLKAFIAVPTRQALDEARALFFHHRSRVEVTEQRFRLLLYLVSLALLAILVLLGLRLRTRAVALRQRAAFEHVIAENSTRLINCSPAEMEARLKQVLGEFSRTIGADRAHVVPDEKPVRSHLWSADAKPFTLGSQTNGALDLARAVHEIVPFKPVLLAAASSIEVSANALAEAGISEVLRWPLVSSELAAALDRCLYRPATLRS